MIRKIPVIILSILLCAGCAMMASKHGTQKTIPPHHYDETQHNCATCHSLSKEEAKTLLNQFGEVKDVKLAPVKGLYEVTLQEGNQQMTAYVDFSKKLILAGRIYAINTRKMMTPKPKKVPLELSNAQLESIKLGDSIIMGNDNGQKRMFVFTDPDCPYCKRLHEELKKLVSMEPDLAIYIKMYPLKMHPKAYDKARVVLGARSLDMLDKAFAGKKLPSPGEKDPKKPVDDTIKLAHSLGIKGTPAIVFPDGKLVTGFRNAGDMHAVLTPSATAKSDAKKAAGIK
ncbi:MAG: DsbC family protein [Desulfobacteraceae bacterium]